MKWLRWFRWVFPVVGNEGEGTYVPTGSDIKIPKILHTKDTNFEKENIEALLSLQEAQLQERAKDCYSLMKLRTSLKTVFSKDAKSEWNLNIKDAFSQYAAALFRADTLRRAGQYVSLEADVLREKIAEQVQNMNETKDKEKVLFAKVLELLGKAEGRSYREDEIKTISEMVCSKEHLSIECHKIDLEIHSLTIASAVKGTSSLTVPLH